MLVIYVALKDTFNKINISHSLGTILLSFKNKHGYEKVDINGISGDSRF